MRTRTLAVFGVLAVAGLFVASGSAAGAATPTSGLWYFDTFHVQAAHDAGWTGKGVTVAVLDGQIDPVVPTLAGANLVVEPSDCQNAAGVTYAATSTTQLAFHATNTVSLLVGSGAAYPGQTGVKGIAPGARVLFYMTAPAKKIGSPAASECTKPNSPNFDANAEAINSAVKAGAQIISVSLGGHNSPALSLALANAEHRGVIVLGALNNTKGQAFTSGESPALNNGVVSVQAINSKGRLQTSEDSANIDYATDVVGPGVGILTQGSDRATGSFKTQGIGAGTSFATPVVAGFLALVKQKYPNATGNQLIQSLITNTGVADHPVEHSNDGYGYGAASVTHMLSVDPSKYPDKNPLIATGPNTIAPPASAIANPPSLKDYIQEISGGALSSPGVGTSVASQPPVGLFISIGVIVLVVILGLVALIIGLAVRRTRRDGQQATARGKG